MSSFRPATMDDVDAVVDLVNRERLAQRGVTATIAQNVRRRWTQEGLDLDRDTRLVIGNNGTPSGYICFENIVEPISRPYANLSIDPDVDTVAVGNQLVQWLVTRARDEVSRVPDDVRVTVLAWAWSENEAVLGALARAGFGETRRYYGMRIEFDAAGEVPDDHTIPAGYEVRPLRRGEERELYRTKEEAFEDHYGHGEKDDSDEAFARWRRGQLEPEIALPELQLVAVAADGSIAGFSLCRSERPQDKEMGSVDMLGVHPQHRRKGLGEALLLESFAALRRLGKKRAGLSVDATSITNATRLYEKCGMHVDSTTIQMGLVIREGREVANVG